tara:strand:+ start:290 stop:463 length:174 start_codon:yes stop_codon:yes gene_type:complete
MEKNTGGINRIIRILEEELTELQTVGLYERANSVRKRLEAYRDMRDKGNGINNEQQR